jgi:UDP-2,3-diacylglucosamine hydrolase
MYYFASDMHLGLEYNTPAQEREKRLVRWLDTVAADAEAIMLVGDVFDFWFEWKRVVPKGFARVLGKLAELADRGVRVHFFTGNHDMWAYDYLHSECGVTVHQRPEVFEAYGRKIFVAHGDNLYLRKTRPVQIRIMNGFFYSHFWRRAFAVLVHPDVAMRFGLWWSSLSRKSKRVAHKFKDEEEYLVKYAREYGKCVDIDYFVFGHLHTAIDYRLDERSRVVILGEWIVNPTYAVLRPDGEIELRRFE